MEWTPCSQLSVLLILLTSCVTRIHPFAAARNYSLSEHNEQFLNYSYSIVFDAGSTGTRIHVFTFQNVTGSNATLSDEYFQDVCPGLSSYADEPVKAADSIIKLLEKAKNVVPKCQWSQTPVVLKATAGLRLLPAHSSEAILTEILKLFHKYPFSIDNNAVSIMDGTDEGLFGWFSVNFLLGALSDLNKSSSVLDLGGGSTQVTFLPFDLNTFFLTPKEYIVKKIIRNKHYILYCYSYLGLGLMSARISIMRLSSFHKEAEDENVTELTSPCFHPDIQNLWIYEREKFLVKGSQYEKYGFESCYGHAVVFLNNTVNKPQNLRRQQIYGLSYYFDTASDLGIIDPKNGGVVTVGQYKTAAKKVCRQKNIKKLFLCLDATYIIALLTNSLGMNKDNEIMLVKKINNIEASWALGAAFSLLS